MESAVAYFKLLFIPHGHIFWTVLNSMLKQVRNAIHHALVLVYTYIPFFAVLSQFVQTMCVLFAPATSVSNSLRHDKY